MQNFLSYFYNINVEDITQINNKYSFIYNNDAYILEELKDVNEALIIDTYNLCIELLQNGIMCNQIILNNENKIVTYNDNKIWVLMKTVNNYNERVTFQDIFSFPIKANVEIAKNNDWKTLWSNKIDYLEYQINQFGLDYPILRESFAYFNGLCENAIQLFNEVTNDDLYIMHKRIKYNMSYYDFYNPFNMILDTKVRDMAEYFKDAFIFKSNIDTELELFLNNYYLNNNERLLFIIRMFYPTFYLDIFEKIINKQISEEEIAKIISNIDKYEELLYKLTKITGFHSIEWLKKSNQI